MNSEELISYFKKQLYELKDEIIDVVGYNCYEEGRVDEDLIKGIFKERLWELKLLEIDSKYPVNDK